jgi:hypothetical protein
VTPREFRQLNMWVVAKTAHRRNPWHLNLSIDDCPQVETEEFGLGRDHVVITLPASVGLEEAKVLIARKFREASPCRPPSPASAIADACDH